jgi:Anthrone oxygenase
MTDFWAISMLISGGLFAGGAASIALERLPAWRATELSEFRVAFAHTLRRVDPVQPALLTVCLASTIAFALSAQGAAKTLALVAAAAFLLILIGSATLLVPVQRRLASSRAELLLPEAERLRDFWLRGHLIRTVAALGALVLAVVASVS